MAATASKGLTRAEGIRWDLSAIHQDAEEARAAWAEQLTDAAAFQERWRGRVGELDEEQLAHLLDELSQLLSRSLATASYAQLRQFADSGVAENQDLSQAAEEADVQFTNLTRFFKLEWQALPPEIASRLAQSTPRARGRHFLERLTEQATHSLSAEVEEALAERATAAVSAWKQLFGQTTSDITAQFAIGDEPARVCTIADLRAYQHHESSEVRRRAMAALHSAAEPWTAVLAKVYDTLVGDRLMQDRLRHFVSAGPDPQPQPMQQANAANDLPDSIVDTMIEAVERNYGTAHRYFRVKAQLMGLEKLLLSDVRAPLGPVRECRFDEGRDLILDAMRGFSPRAEEILSSFFDERRIDAEPRAGKQSGAFCDGVAQNRAAFVLTNYTDLVQDAEVLAHELGHGLHAALAKQRQGQLVYESGLGLAEVASTFNEMVLFDHLLARESDPRARLGLISARVERSFTSIFSQTMMTRYEQRAYAAKIRGESLNRDRLAAVWREESQRYYGENVVAPPGARFTWSLVPHFIYARFYTYSYVFAHLVSLALYDTYLKDRAALVPRYFELLAAGGSQPPTELLLALDIDLSNPRWVDQGFALINSWIDLAARSAPEPAPGS